MTTRILRTSFPASAAANIALESPVLALHCAPARTGGEVIDVWYVDHDEEPTSERVVFDVYGTGHPLPDHPGHYVGTCVMPSGLVWHVFARNVSEPSDSVDNPNNEGTST